MSSFSKYAWTIFEQVISDYHKFDDVDTPISIPNYPNNSEEFYVNLSELLYKKCWIDTVQWHLEDLIRDPEINPVDALALKRRIDKSNQDRTDLVEEIDEYFDGITKMVPDNDAPINTETPAWAIDRLSILSLKIYHMQEQTERTDVDESHIQKCRSKLHILNLQREDLSTAIDTLLEDIFYGRKKMRLYKQMKMYNDESTNPVLYGKKA